METEQIAASVVEQRKRLDAAIRALEGPVKRHDGPSAILNGSAKAAAFILFPVLVLAQGGPPFLSDDPDTPGNKHWESNMGFTGERNPFGGSYETPNMDVNYGVGNRIQLKYEVPLSIEEMRGDASHVAAGLGNSLLGLKCRFYEHHSKTHCAPR